MKAKDMDLFIPAMRVFGTILTTNDDIAIANYIQCGLLDGILSLIQSPNTSVLRESLWLISNIVAGPP